MSVVVAAQIRSRMEPLHRIETVELGLHGDCMLWAPKEILIRQEGQFSWTVFPCDCILSSHEDTLQGS